MKPTALAAVLAVIGATGCGEPATTPQKSALTSPSPSAEPITPETPRPERIAARHILVTFAGSDGAAFGGARSKEAGLARAESILAKLQAGATFGEVAKKTSDDASRGRGGFLGSGESGTWVPAFEDVAFSLAVGEISGIVETRFGYHIIQRDALEEIHLLHLVVQYKGARLAESDGAASRSKQDAQAIAESALAELVLGASFQKVAADFSDGPMGLRGADLGWFIRGELGPAFDAAAFVLEIGGTSKIVETPFGFHIIHRVE
jgi:hypothetical protein